MAFDRLQRAPRRKTAVALEMERILGMPVELPPDSVEAEVFCKMVTQAHAFEDGFRLMETQVASVLAYMMYGGLFGSIGVGFGKTLISLMVAQHAFEGRGLKKVALFVPSQVYTQLLKTDLPWARKRVVLSVPMIGMGGRRPNERLAASRSGKLGCYIMTYSMLSTANAEEVLNNIAPELIILDEAHNLKNKRAGRTGRLLRYLEANEPEMVALSGTITSKSIMDYHHIMRHCLGKRMPLPLPVGQAKEWSYVLDAGADPSKAQTGGMAPLIRWCQRTFPTVAVPEGSVPAARHSFRARMKHAPGVVTTGAAEIGVSLTIANQPVPNLDAAPGMELLKQKIKEVEELWQTPSGDEIEFPFHKWKYLYELSTGFYYDLRWPAVDRLARRYGGDEGRAAEALERAQDHHAYVQAYNRDLRKFLRDHAQKGLDTPLLVAKDMAMHGADNVGGDLYRVWRAAKEREFEHMPERSSIPIRLCSFKVNAALAWAARLKRGGVVWFHHTAAGAWLVELLEEAGIDHEWCPSAGIRNGANDIVRDPANKDKILVASISAHGTGKNLQHFAHQYYLQWPRQANVAEQVLGRLHRKGQLADELTALTCNTLEFDHQNMSACLTDSLYVHQTSGSRQKLIYASYDPTPSLYPPDFLRERGIDAKLLDAEMSKIAQEKFGEFKIPTKK